MENDLDEVTAEDEESKPIPGSSNQNFRKDGSSYIIIFLLHTYIFSFSSVIGKLDPPTNERRQVLRFTDNSNMWHMCIIFYVQNKFILYFYLYF